MEEEELIEQVLKEEQLWITGRSSRIRGTFRLTGWRRRKNRSRRTKRKRGRRRNSLCNRSRRNR